MHLKILKFYVAPITAYRVTGVSSVSGGGSALNTLFLGLFWYDVADFCG